MSRFSVHQSVVVAAGGGGGGFVGAVVVAVAAVAVVGVLGSVLGSVLAAVVHALVVLVLVLVGIAAAGVAVGVAGRWVWRRHQHSVRPLGAAGAVVSGDPALVADRVCGLCLQETPQVERAAAAVALHPGGAVAALCAAHLAAAHLATAARAAVAHGQDGQDVGRVVTGRAVGLAQRWSR